MTEWRVPLRNLAVSAGMMIVAFIELHFEDRKSRKLEQRFQPLVEAECPDCIPEWMLQ